MQVDGAVRLLHGERVGLSIAGQVERNHGNRLAAAQVGQPDAQPIDFAGGGAALLETHL